MTSSHTALWRKEAQGSHSAADAAMLNKTLSERTEEITGLDVTVKLSVLARDDRLHSEKSETLDESPPCTHCGADPSSSGGILCLLHNHVTAKKSSLSAATRFTNATYALTSQWATRGSLW